jgi:hypothetical protein
MPLFIDSSFTSVYNSDTKTTGRENMRNTIIIYICILAMSISCTTKKSTSTTHANKFKTELNSLINDPNYAIYIDTLLKNSSTTSAFLSNDESNLKLKKDLEDGQFKHCPNGHDTLLIVPVRSGFAIFDKRKKEVNDYKWWPGGCTRSGDSVLRCTSCPKKYDPLFGKWSDAHIYKLDESNTIKDE